MFKPIFFTLIIINIVLCRKKTTHDPEFEKKFQVTHIKEGDGKHFPHKGDKMHVHYNARFLNGTEFDGSYGNPKPFRFILGMGAVIKCWDLVGERMSLGEKLTVVCPYDLAYGEKGFADVPPKADVVFDIELIEIEKKQEDL